MPVLALVETIIGFEKSSSDAELQMLRGLKKTNLVQLRNKSRLKSSRNKPKLIGRVLEKWRSDNSVSMDEDEELTGAVASLGKTRDILEQAKD